MQALNINDLSPTAVSGGLKQALIHGVNKAVTALDAAAGFFGNSAVKIPLPEALKKAESTLRMLWMAQ